jgi:hypothetical protein
MRIGNPGRTRPATPPARSEKAFRPGVMEVRRSGPGFSPPGPEDRRGGPADTLAASLTVETGWPAFSSSSTSKSPFCKPPMAGVQGSARPCRIGDDPPSPWPPKTHRTASGSSLRNVGDMAKDRGYGGVIKCPRNRHPWPSRHRRVETPQTLCAEPPKATNGGASPAERHRSDPPPPPRPPSDVCFGELTLTRPLSRGHQGTRAPARSTTRRRSRGSCTMKSGAKRSSAGRRLKPQVTATDRMETFFAASMSRVSSPM